MLVCLRVCTSELADGGEVCASASEVRALREMRDNHYSGLPCTVTV